MKHGCSGFILFENFASIALHHFDIFSINISPFQVLQRAFQKTLDPISHFVLNEAK